MQNATDWRLDMGAFCLPEGVQFRVWAPHAQQVDVYIMGPEPRVTPMVRDATDMWRAVLPGSGAGTRYTYRLHGQASFPDPYSRSQPEGVHGPSEVVDPGAYIWHDQDWRGLDMQGLVIYECHIGTATPEGTCDALIAHLERLRQLGVSAIELMPVAACPGRRNWGYDGVGLFAVSANYGGPAALKCLVDAAHQHGLGVILDVVYNHLGPEGNYLGQFTPAYFSTRYRTPWGEALNYDGEQSRQVRQWVIDNACYWLHEYHMDGLRLDSTSNLYDSSQPHILQELTQTVRASLPDTRRVVLIAETSANDRRYLLPVEAGGYGFDAIWADDFSWTVLRYLTGDHEGRYQDYEGTLTEVARTINQGFLYEGQWSASRKNPRGTLARQQPAWQFQYCLQHHDHVGNRALGERLHHRLDLARYRVASALLLLLPYTPLLFMGQEFATSAPFPFFTDHSPEVGQLVTEGRRREFAAYAAFADTTTSIPDPQAETTFRRALLPVEECLRSPGGEIHRLYQALLQLRRTDPVLRQQNRQAMQAHAVTADLLLVFWWHEAAHRVLLVNFGAATAVRPATWIDISATSGWQLLFASNEKRFGGSGEPVSFPQEAIQTPAHAAILLGLG